jgi:hypothetical protein
MEETIMSLSNWNLKFLALFLSLTFTHFLYAGQCVILIHGFSTGSDGTGFANSNYFGSQPNQYQWNSHKKIRNVAHEFAQGLSDKINSTCGNNMVSLKAHSYGNALTYYTLSYGKFVRYYYDRGYTWLAGHSYYGPFLNVYNKTDRYVAYTGAFRGTPLMDTVCSNWLTSKLGGFAGKPCVPSLKTDHNEHPATLISYSNPGVSIKAVYSIRYDGYARAPGNLIGLSQGGSLTSFHNWVENDNTLPAYSTLACSSNERNPSSGCSKTNSYFNVGNATRGPAAESNPGRIGHYKQDCKKIGWGWFSKTVCSGKNFSGSNHTNFLGDASKFNH